MEHFDIVIVGAGLHGLAIARTLVGVCSDDPKRLVILDEGLSIGGTWAAERLYPGLKTNNVVGSYEFSDFPMDPGRYGLRPGQHIPGPVVHRYFADFAAHFGLDGLFSPQTRVEAASLREDGTWQLDCKSSRVGGPRARKLTCDKLIIATGLTSEARMPTFPGSSDFSGPLFHAKDLHRRSRDLEGCREVVVVGGNKSAWDVCYAVATTGARAHMVMRPSGGGPSWVWRPISLFGVRLTLARLSSTRLFSWFDPAPFGSSFSSIRRLLHETLLGTWLVWVFWALLDLLASTATGYNDPQLRMLRPWTSTFWMGNSLSIHNYETDWFELVRKGLIVVHHADIIALKETTAQLSNGEDLRADAVVCCTGWKCTPPIIFKPEGIAEEIGLPHEAVSRQQDPTKAPRDSPHQSLRETSQDHEVQSWARAQARRRCAQLGFSPRRTLPGDGPNPPRRRLSLKPHSAAPLALDGREAPYRLYRSVVPAGARFLGRRSLAFVGMHRSVHAVIVAQAQALWIAAYFFSSSSSSSSSFSGGGGSERQHLAAPLDPDPETARREAASRAEYQRLRRPRASAGAGASFPDLVFDSLPYADLLLEDLGLRAMRKRGLWANVTAPHLPADYRGLLDEWLAKTRD
ncbi:hypothetical protein SAMD00023353_1901560 [Rosellinia necatrix]|uniref:FAD/NAD(P)-binding domain-containing protein n=1 Tax=Rosellinia necatrix TaxID=77044 RepID=A0A1W2TEH7_ROSNE|nr:hypothetical protein SAMD00023353_1901560 [Rosellinia necatrix]